MGFILNDQQQSTFIADSKNDRIMCWSSKSKEGRIVVGEDSNQFNYPIDLLFDFENNLYVVDWRNHRIQRFEVDQNWTIIFSYFCKHPSMMSFYNRSISRYTCF